MRASGGTLRLLSHAHPFGLLTGVWLAFAPQTSHIPETQATTKGGGRNTNEQKARNCKLWCRNIPN